MSDPYNGNTLHISLLNTLVGDEADLEVAEAAFEATPGDFAARFKAAMQARMARHAQPEVFIEIPEDPAALSKADLEALVRPVADGFLRSYPTKDELLDQVSRIELRQQRRPAWIPRIDPHGRALAPPHAGTPGYEAESDRPVVISAIPELGDVTILVPEAGNDRPELEPERGGSGEWESAMHTLLGLAGPRLTHSTIRLDAEANLALVPEQARWWSSHPATALQPHQDPGVASELLATSATLGGKKVADNSPVTRDAVADALLDAGDWRFSPRWQLEFRDPRDDRATIVSARAAIAGWSRENRSGAIAYVYGGAVNEDGQTGFPSPLHNYLLVVERASDGTDAVEAVYRVVLSCPDETWCHRGGCPDSRLPEAAGMLLNIVAAGDAMSAVFSSGGESAETFRALYGECDAIEYADSVLECATLTLTGADWVELERLTWDGGLEQVLLRRGEACLTVLYDPINRQIRLTDGLPDLEMLLETLGEEGVLIEHDGHESVEFAGSAAEQWDADVLAAAEDLLRGRIKGAVEGEYVLPVQVTVLGLHPHADGTLRAPGATELADDQISALLRTAGVIPLHQ